MHRFVWLKLLLVLNLPVAAAEPVKIFELEQMQKPNNSQLALWLDVAIPGYGTYHYREYWWALGYASAKIGGATMIYLAVVNHRYWNSVAIAAEKRQQQEPDLLYFADPQRGGWVTAQELRNRADSAFVMIVYASLFEALVYVTSFYHTWRLYELQRLKSVPLYRMQSEKNGEMRMDLGWQHTW